jgi:hypothetical protein
MLETLISSHLFATVLEFRVADAGSGGCHLQISTLEHLDIAHGIATDDDMSLGCTIE